MNHKFVFVLMPFDVAYDDLYHVAVKGACRQVNLTSVRVDEQIFKESILQRVYSQISEADIVIAVMTGRNPNVFYEVGYAHALGKTVILLTAEASDIPFDLKHFPHIVYGASLKVIHDELVRQLKYWCCDTPVDSLPEVSTPLALTMPTQEFGEWGFPQWLRELPSAVVHGGARLVLLLIAIVGIAAGAAGNGEWTFGLVGVLAASALIYSYRRRPAGHLVLLFAHGIILLWLLASVLEALFTKTYANLQASSMCVAIEVGVLLTLWRLNAIRNYYRTVGALLPTLRAQFKRTRRAAA